MASRWIKVDTETPYKREITKVMEDCGCNRATAFLAFFDLFAWFDERAGADGILEATREDCDRKACLHGLAASLEASGWLSFPDPYTCLVVNFAKHNGQSAKQRALNARASALRRAGL